MVRLKLPYPVSANRYWRIWRNKAVRSAEATAYKSVVRRIAQEAGVMPSEGSVAVCLRLIPKANKDGSANKTVIDLDNALKVTLDALQGIAYENDKQVRLIFAGYADEPEQYGGTDVIVMSDSLFLNMFNRVVKMINERFDVTVDGLDGF